MKVAMLTVLRLDILEQYKLARQYGIEIDVLTNGNEPNYLFGGRKYISQCNLNEKIINYNNIADVCKEYDVITGYEFYGDNQKTIMKNFDNFIPEVAWNIPTYGTHFGNPDMESLNLAKIKVKSFIAKSQSVYDCLIQEGIEKEKIFLINATCNTDRFMPREKPNRLKDTLVFLFIGRLQEQKGIFELFHAFVRANIPNSKLILIGPQHPTNPWSINELKKWIKIKHADVEIHSYVTPEDIHLFYNWGDVFITLPNTGHKFIEQIGLTVPQALASGLPVITNDFGGQVDFIDDSCGFLVPHKNYVKVAEAMKVLTNEKRRKKMGVSARQHILLNFNLDNYTQHIKNIYETVL
jgi:glycosyltransferase involved in cell wall biosynthesis